MACMEHVCAECGHAWFDNRAHVLGGCPHCGGRVISTFDENLADYDDRRDEEAREDEATGEDDDERG